MTPPSSTPSYRGFFFNLEQNQKRRAALTQRLQEIGLASNYQRFPAIDGRAVASQYPTKLDPGALGLWLTHEQLLREQRGSDLHLHLLEDDALLGPRAAACFEPVLRSADQRLPDWDAIFTDTFVDPSPDLFLTYYRKMKDHARTGSISLLNLAGVGFAGATSLFINRASIGKHADLIQGKWSLGIPIDLYIRQLVNQGALKAYLSIPFLTSLTRDSVESDIRGAQDRSRMVCDVLRQGFFLEADPHALCARMQELTQGVNVPPLVQLFGHAVTFGLSDQWVGF